MIGLLASAGADAIGGFPLLPAIVLLPALGTLAIVLIPRERVDAIRLTAIVTSLATGVLTIYLLAVFDPHDGGFQFVSSADWIRQLDIKFALGVDGISLFLVVLTGVLFPIALFAVKPDHDAKGYYAWITLLEVGCMGVFLALDLFLFFLAFEVTIIPLYFLIAQWGHGRRVYAATKFFLYTMFGSVLMLVAIVVLAWQTGAGEGGAISFDFVKIVRAGGVDGALGNVLFLGFAIAFAIKTPVFPFHTWLPDAHTEAPTAGSVDLAGVLLKLGTFGFLRYGLELFPGPAKTFAPLMMTLAVIGIVYGAVVAAMQKNLKRLVAYSSVSHMGFAILGLFALTTVGIEGSVLVMVNHGITTGALFILLGFLYSRRHTYEISQLRGIQKAAPIFAGVFTVVMLASIGLPGLNGFVGEFLALLGAYLAQPVFAVVAAVGVIFAALYLLWAYQRVFHGTPDEANASFPDLRPMERAVVAPLLALIVFLGVYPKPVLERVEPSVRRVVVSLEAANSGWREPGSGISVVPARDAARHESGEPAADEGEGR